MSSSAAAQRSSTTAQTAQFSPDGPLGTIGFCGPEDAYVAVSAILSPGGLALSPKCREVARMVDACEKGAPDLTIIAARRPDGSILDGIHALGEACPDMRTVLICERSAAGDVRKALDAGATGIVSGDELEEVLLPVLRVVASGQISVPGMRGKEATQPILTTREKQILGLVVMGMTNAQIASKLFLAESTVKSHLSSAFAKLEVASRNEAVNLILDPRRGAGLGILTIPTESRLPPQTVGN